MRRQCVSDLSRAGSFITYGGKIGGAIEEALERVEKFDLADQLTGLQQAFLPQELPQVFLRSLECVEHLAVWHLLMRAPCPQPNVTLLDLRFRLHQQPLGN